ncbi:MAG: 4-oxalomesaconate tautomerase [Rhodoplanes sp.]|uniref:4-oxalomesaconate tautomerase n=1 Tax=Rhodoplanes sp. TaxID=1968906 RepID=UPI0018132ECB|nr:4-oxalomesaconate tautomerase [Rhodoplanes sp.]NVO12910.1 4-oxalomesaconate tautomerase [Rhodoplanes sp.]
MILRGGTSKGAYFLADDLPVEKTARDRILLAALGSPDPRQIDGIGGAHPLTSKVAIVSRSTAPGIDIDFLFAQVSVDRAKVDTTPNCGNILAGVGPFAIERGLVAATAPSTKVTVRTVNTGTVAELLIATPHGTVEYSGDARIDGVPGTAAPIPINFLDAAGSVCGSLLPTGNPVDVVQGVPMTLIDNGMPVVVIEASALGKTGYETPQELMADSAFRSRLEAIRLEVGPLMKLGDVTSQVVPKMVLVAPPKNGGHVSTRSFIPHECHAAIGVFAAVSVATACVLPGSPAQRCAVVPPGPVKTMSVEHPTGEFTVRLEVGDGTGPVVERAGLLRTARLLFDGRVFVPAVAAEGFAAGATMAAV